KYSYIGLFFFTLINFIFIISAAGVNLLLSFPRFEYRTFIFHGFYLSFLLLSFYKIFYTGVYKKYFIILSSIVCFYFLSISLNVSNAQKSQSKFEEEIIFNLVNDIYKLKINNNKEFVFIGKSKVFNVDTLINKYPIIEYLVTHPVHYAYKIQKYYLYKLRIFTFNNKEQENNFWSNNNSNFILLIDGFFYKIYENETQVIIFLKEGSGENN
ncbi:hypothetical protein ABLU07_15245, partial [Acinetobacter radioresistens]|uniref:hypothetical protein n=1 Tax=Acinetobacter radioresistens TaxID=40216 RepID=UPI0032B5F7E2